ncbi:MAG: outer membrane protein assembly factor BamB [Candidatus Methylopumilus sp.]|nr:outer membrane protein assembly factor BamB [Candidatus Methylopumilus sp.]
MYLRHFFLLFISLLIFGCGPLKDFKDQISERVVGQNPIAPPADLKDIKASLHPKILWSGKLGGSELFEFSPGIIGDEVYAASSDGSLAKFDLKTGKSIWKINTNEKLSGGVGTGINEVVVGTLNGMILAYDLNSKLLWKTRLSSQVLSAPTIHEGNVIVRTSDNLIHGVNVKDGLKRWTFSRVGPPLNFRTSVGVVASDGAVYAGFPGGKLVAIREDNGTLLWEITVAQPKGVTEIERASDVTSSPVIDGTIIYAVAYQGKISAINRINARILWSRDISSYTGINIEGARIYLSHAGGALYSLAIESGKTYWRQGDLLNRQLSTPLAMGNYIAVGDLEGYIHILDKETGNFLGRVRLDSNSVMRRMVEFDTGKFIAQTLNGSLYAISIQ